MDSQPTVYADADGVCSGLNNCPVQQNTAAGSNNGESIAGDDLAVPSGDSQGDACDDDGDNDGITDRSDGDPCPRPGRRPPAGAWSPGGL